MSITTYAELKTAVANWLDRSDLTSRIPEFIALTESAINYGIRGPTNWVAEPLRIRSMEASADITITSGSGSLPTGYLAARRFYLNTSPKVQLDYVSPLDFYGRDFANTSGQPEAYTIEGESFVFGPAGSGTGKLLYYKSFTPMSADGDATTLLTNNPGVYLHGALYEAYSYVEDVENADRYLLRYAAAVNALNAADVSDRHSGAVMTMRPSAVA